MLSRGDLSSQAHQGNVELHTGHCGILEALMAIDALNAVALLTCLGLGQVVFAQAHLPSLQFICIPGERRAWSYRDMNKHKEDTLACI